MCSRSGSVLALILCWITGLLFVAAEVPSGTRSVLEALVDSELRDDPGGFGAILFSDREELWSRESGAGGGVSLVRDTPLMLGTLSGRFVILAAVQLAEEGKLDLARPVQSWVRELPAVASLDGSLALTGRTSLGALAAEASGRMDAIPRVVPRYDAHRNLLEALDARGLRFPAGLKRTQSDGCIDLLALAVERAAGSPWKTVIEHRVLQRLGMARSRFVTPVEGLREAAFYHQDGERLDDRLVAGLLPPLTPSGSLQSTLADLANCGARMLRAWEGSTAEGVAPAAVRRALSPAIPGQLDRQGFASGLGWILTEPRLRYLGQVAWNAGLEVTHRTHILLLPDQRLGIVLATVAHDPEGPFRLRRLAAGLIREYARLELGLQAPEFRIPPTFPRVPESSRLSEGLYASEAGIAQVAFDGDLLIVEARGSYGQFAWEGPDRFVPLEENELEAVEVRDREHLVLLWRSGSRLEVAFRPEVPLGLPLRPGTCQVQGTSRAFQRNDVCLIDRVAGHWVLYADDGQRYLLQREADGTLRPLCDEASRVFGCSVTLGADGEIRVLGP